jgi:undecaprenyl-diphosphatase
LLGGLAVGLNRETAARYSFLLSVPAVFAAGVYKLIKEREVLVGTYDQRMNLLVGLVAAAVVGYLSIDWLLRYLRKRSTFVFIAYRMALAILIVAMLQGGWIHDDVPTATTAARDARHSTVE